MEPKNEVDLAMMSVALIADRLVRSEMIEAHVKRPEAESTVARRAGLSPFTLQNLKRGRLKHVDAVGSKIRSAFIATLERQLAALETELVAAPVRISETIVTLILNGCGRSSQKGLPRARMRRTREMREGGCDALGRRQGR